MAEHRLWKSILQCCNAFLKVNHSLPTDHVVKTKSIRIDHRGISKLGLFELIQWDPRPRNLGEMRQLSKTFLKKSEMDFDPKWEQRRNKNLLSPKKSLSRKLSVAIKDRAGDISAPVSEGQRSRPFKPMQKRSGPMIRGSTEPRFCCSFDGFKVNFVDAELLLLLLL